jgi:four helix bundle protein
MGLDDLEIYRLSKEFSKEAWEIYKGLDWETKKTVGGQFIKSIDSIGANIAEGFGRYHYLDKNKFHYNARGSLFESLHWINLLLERGKISKEKSDNLNRKLNQLGVKLNNYIKSLKERTT